MPLYTTSSSGGGGGGTPPSNAAFGPAWSGSALAPTQNATYAYVSTELLTKSANLVGLADPVAALVNLNGLSTTGGTLTGPLFTAHLVSTGETDISAGTVLDIRKSHTVTLAADRTFTFAGGTASNGDLVQLVTTVTTPCVITFPASLRNGEVSTMVTSLSLPVGTHHFIWKRTSGTWLLFDPITSPRIEHIQVACSDENTALTTGTKLTFRMPYAFKLTGLRASFGTAPTGSSAIMDVKVNGATIMATKLFVDAGEKTSVTAAVPAVISSTYIPDDAEVTIHIDQYGSTIAGAGLKVTFIGYAV